MKDADWSTRTKAAIVLIAQAVSAFMAYGSLLVAGRFFQPESFGMHAFAIGATGLLAVVTDLGVGLAHQRAVAQGQDRGRALTALVVLRVAWTGAVVLLVLLTAAMASGWLEGHLRDTATWNVLAVALLFQLLTIARGIVEATWLGEQRPHLVEAVRVVDAVLTLAVLANAGLLLAALGGVEPPFVGVGRWWAALLGLERPFGVEQGALLLLGSYAVARAVALLVALVWARRDGLRLGPWDAAMARRFVAVAIPLSIAYFLSVVVTSTDVVVLGLLRDARDVAYYAAAQRIATIGLLATLAVGTVLFPRFAQLHAAGEHDSLEATSLHAHRYLLLIVAPMAAAMIALPRQGLLAVVGANYLPSVAPLRWLAVWIVLVALMNPLTARLMGEGRDRLAIAGTVVLALLNVAMNLVLVPRWGATGAAAATALSTAVALMAMVWQSRSRAVKGVLRRHAPSVLAAATLTGLLWAAAGRWLPPSWLDHSADLLVAAMLGLAAYAGLLFLLGGLDRDDVRSLRTLFHPSTWVEKQ